MSKVRLSDVQAAALLEIFEKPGSQIMMRFATLRALIAHELIGVSSDGMPYVTELGNTWLLERGQDK